MRTSLRMCVRMASEPATTSAPSMRTGSSPVGATRGMLHGLMVKSLCANRR